MSHRLFILLILISAPLRLCASPPAAKRPNIVLFLIDDLGWRDLGCQGSDYYKTPHIDRLAAEGVRFTDAYAACAVCSPTRAGLLTGKYPARLLLTQWLPAGRWNPEKHRMREGRFLRSLPLEELTLAEALRESGYRTFHVGKWHLGGVPFSMPRHHGFDVNIAGEDHGAPGSYFYPYKGKWTVPTTGLAVQKQTLKDGVEGDWKLIEFLESGRVELYNLADDIGETTNLAEAMPDLARRLLENLHTWKESTGADPMLPNPDFESP